MTDTPRTFEEALNAVRKYRKVDREDFSHGWDAGVAFHDPEIAEKDRRIAELERLANYYNVDRIAGLKENKALQARIAELRGQLNEERVAHEDIGVWCAEIGAATKDGTSVSAVKSLVEMYRARQAQIDAVMVLANTAHRRSEKTGNPAVVDADELFTALGEPATTPENMCICGLPRSHSKHVKYGADLDNPAKHEFRPDPERGPGGKRD